jgi:predicted permease
MRSSLVVVEVALSVVLLAGAGLMIKSFVRVARLDPGFDVEHVLTLQVELPYGSYSRSDAVSGFLRDLVARVERIPGVRAAAAVSRLPLAGDRSTSGLVLEGRPVPPGGGTEVHYRVITPGYFAAMGIPLRGGRAFDARDQRAAPPVAIVNETLARRVFPGEAALGRRIRLGPNPRSPWIEVVGVAADARHFGLESEARAEAYVSFDQSPAPRARIVIRTAGDPLEAAAPARAAVGSIDRDLPVAEVQTLHDLVGESVAPRRVSMTLLALFAAMALVLASTGIYGVIAYTVERRRHELGIRVALGAGRGQILRLVVGEAIRLTMAGIAIGLGGAWALGGLISGLLYGAPPGDPPVLAAVCLLLVAVSIAASAIPARRATRVDPLAALRYE